MLLYIWGDIIHLHIYTERGKKTQRFNQIIVLNESPIWESIIQPCLWLWSNNQSSCYVKKFQLWCKFWKPEYQKTYKREREYTHSTKFSLISTKVKGCVVEKIRTTNGIQMVWCFARIRGSKRYELLIMEEIGDFKEKQMTQTHLCFKNLETINNCSIWTVTVNLEVDSHGHGSRRKTNLKLR